MAGGVVALIASVITMMVGTYREAVFPVALLVGWLLARLVWRTRVGPAGIVALRPWGRRVIAWSSVRGANFVPERGSDENRRLLVADLVDGRRLRLMSVAREPSEREPSGDERTDRRVALVTAAFHLQGKPVAGIGPNDDAVLAALWARHGIAAE